MKRVLTVLAFGAALLVGAVTPTLADNAKGAGDLLIEAPYLFNI